MQIEIQLTNAPIAEHLPLPAAGVGAWVEFRGVVRGEENDQPIAALEYEAYAPMAEREMRRLLVELAAQHPCLSARVIHRVGIVPAGEAAIYVGIAGRHRAEAFALLAQFMDRLKQDVPIWKQRAIAETPKVGRVTPCAPEDVAQTSESAVSQVSQPAGACLVARPADFEVGDTAGLETCVTLTGAPSDKRRAASASEVLELVRQLCVPLEAGRVPLADAAGRVLREPACAPEDQPPFDRSSVDGFAVRLDDRATQFRVVDEIRAGDWKPRTLQPGETARIATGGALPGDGLQVVMKENARVEADQLTVLRRDAERNIRFRGEDARAGQVLVEAGVILQSGALALLASVGCAQPLVTRPPRVRHIATGNEIVSPDQMPGRGQIRDSNSTLVRAFFGRWGIVPEQVRVGEEAATIDSALRTSHSTIDLLLISGGASVGEHDFTRGLLERAGFTIHVSKATARPGKPLIVAQRGGTLAFGLPGNPLAHFVCLNLYVRAALEAFAGQSDKTAFVTGVMAEDLAAGAHALETFWPAHWALQEGVAMLTPLRWRSSGDLTSLATANALLRVTAGAEQFQCGSRVEFVRTERS